MAALRLRPLRSDDEPQARAAQEELLADDFTFLLGWEEGVDWQDYLDLCERHRQGEGLTDDLVSSTFLLAQAEGQLVGRISIRHELNDFLMNLGGHIGYCVRPAFRRRGYATEILRQGLVVIRSLGVEEVLVSCDEDNLGSMSVIERLGGVLEDVRPDPDGPLKRRYWIA